MSEVGSLSGRLNALFRRAVSWCAALVLWQSAGWCGFLKKLLAASPQRALKTTGWCFMTFLQGKHKWGQGQTPREGSWAFVQSLCVWPGLLRGAKESKLTVRVSCCHWNWPSLFCGWGPSPGKPKAKLVTILFLMIMSKQNFCSSYVPRKIALSSEWPFFLLRKVANGWWPVKVRKA